MFFTVHQPLNVLYWLCAHCVLSYAFVNYMSTQSCLPLNFWWLFSSCCFHAIQTYQWYSHTCCYSSGHQTFKKKHENGTQMAILLQCYCLVIALSWPYHCHAKAMSLPSLPCHCHAIAMPKPCHCHGTKWHIDLSFAKHHMLLETENPIDVL